MSAKCETCHKTAYQQEQVRADDHVFHKSCFRCVHCKNVLRLGNYASLKGNYYCKPHFKQLFRLRGNYDEGFGGEQHKMKWLSGERGEHPAGEHPATGGSSSVPPAAPAADAHAHETSSEPLPEVLPTPKPVGRWELHESKPESFPSFSGLTMEQMEAAQAAFKKYDADRNGVIDKQELYTLIEDLMIARGKNLAKIVLNSMTDMHFAAADKDKSGGIDEVEFLVLYSDLVISAEKEGHHEATSTSTSS